MRPNSVLPLPTFLVIDFHAESRYLLAKTLLRKFPGATILEMDDAELAVDAARKRKLTAIITHRTFDVGGIELLQQLREADPAVPIVMVSGIDRAEAAMASGATSFLHYDEWLRLGSVVEAHLISRSEPPEPSREHNSGSRT